MDKRRTELLELSSYIRTVDNDVTMILQSLQWDRKHLIEASAMVSCQFDQNHRVPPDKLEDHEKECYLRSLGYSKEEELLPEPLDKNANTLVTFSKTDIANIIEYAAKIDPVFKKGSGSGSTAPLSLAALQRSHSADERRALHDAAVAAAPACHDLGELALLGGDDAQQSSKRKSRVEILSELRDMKRRRTKYRVAAKSRNYSDVLRDVIATQMEHYSEAQTGNSNIDSAIDPTQSRTDNLQTQHKETFIKKEPFEPEETHLKDKDIKRYSSKEFDNRYNEKSRGETRYRENFRDESRYRSNSRDESRHRDHSRDEAHRESSKDESHRNGSRNKACNIDNYRNETRHRDNSRDETRDRENSRDKNRHRENSRNDRHRENRNESHLDRTKDVSKEREKRYNEYNRHDGRNDRRDDRDRHSNSSKERHSNKRDYGTSDRSNDFHDSRKDYKVIYKREDEDSYENTHRGDKHRTYYDYKQDDFEVRSKRIKLEKD